MERFKKIRELYEAALEKKAAERTAFLDKECMEDEALRGEVESLLSYDANGLDFIETPALEIAAKELAQSTGGLVGRRINQYHVMSLIGAGGMGEVYLARDTKLDRLIAIKILPPDINEDPASMQRFIREAKTASALNHPNVATIYEVGESDGINFIAMEYVEGQTLSARIAERAVELAEIVDVGKQVADALDAASIKGITHRDIKPANLMLTPRGQVKVLDFGLAKTTRPEGESLPGGSSITSKDAGLVMGSLPYMSPEQALGWDVDHRSDIYSLGATLYEMAAGRPPFVSASGTGTAGQILHAQPEAISGFNAKASFEFNRIVHKCLEKTRERRYQAAKELLSDLTNLQRSMGTMSPATDGVTPRRRIVGPASLALSVILLFFIGIAVLSRYGAEDPIDSIAVLPFVAGGDSDTEYLSDGITESLINSLTRLRKVIVVPRTRVIRYKGRQIDPAEAGSELKVRALVTGHITLRGDMVSIQAELVDVAKVRQLWSDRYERKRTDILQVQDEIVKSISENLRLQLAREDERRLVKHNTDNAQAYDLYVRGRFLWNKFTLDGVRASVDYFNRALAIDPQYALAYAGLADAYILLGQAGLPPQETYPKAKRYADQALELDPSLPEAHTCLGAYEFYYGWDWEAADRELRSAIGLDPNLGGAHDLTGQLLLLKGRRAEGLAALKRAVATNPFSPLLSGDLEYVYYYTGEYQSAVRQGAMTLELDPNAFYAAYIIGLAHAQQGNHAQAVIEFTKTRNLPGGFVPGTSGLGYVYAISGKRAEAEKMLKELNSRTAVEYVDPYFVALIHHALGDANKALALLDQAFDERSVWLPPIKMDPKFERLRSDPRIIKLVRRIGVD